MEQYFVKDYTGDPFLFLGIHHIVTMLILVAINMSWVFLRNRMDEKARRTVRITIAVVLLVNELSWHIWNWAVGQWNIQTMLPLHICSVTLFASIYMLLTRNYSIYEFAYFLGIGTASQAVLTPDCGIYGYPHYRFFQTFISHGGIVTAAIYMTVVEGFRPTLRSLLRVAIWGNVYMLVVTGINLLIGSNYMFTLHKPETASLFDVLGPWPWYLVITEGIALVVFLLLYLPFFISDRRKTQAALPAMG